MTYKADKGVYDLTSNPATRQILGKGLAGAGKVLSSFTPSQIAGMTPEIKAALFAQGALTKVSNKQDK